MTRRIRGATVAIGLLGLSVAITACAGPSDGMTPATSPSSISGVVEITPGRDPTDAGRPPTASLAVDGGDPVEGSLGTYTWGDVGSDAPWLQGAPISVGPGEPMTMTVSPASAIDSWEARLAPPGADGPQGSRTIGRGRGLPVIEPPGAGAWTLEVRVVFAEGLGEARYFWRVGIE